APGSSISIAPALDAEAACVPLALLARLDFGLTTVTGNRATDVLGTTSCPPLCNRHHLNSRFVFTRLRCATSETDTPGSAHSCTIASRCSGVYLRRDLLRQFSPADPDVSLTLVSIYPQVDI